MPMNKTVVRKMIKRIKAVPASYDQAAFYVEPSDGAPCGTIACLAGEAIICSAVTVEKGIKKAMRLFDKGGITDVADKLLGLPVGHGIFGMSGCDWPKPYNKQMAAAKTARRRSEVAVAYLTEALERGEMVW